MRILPDRPGPEKSHRELVFTGGAGSLRGTRCWIPRVSSRKFFQWLSPSWSTSPDAWAWACALSWTVSWTGADDVWLGLDGPLFWRTGCDGIEVDETGLIMAVIAPVFHLGQSPSSF